MAEYGLDLRVEFRRMPARRLWAMIENLPLSSPVWSGDEQWTRTDELLATIFERIDGWGRLQFAAMGGKADMDPGEWSQKIKRPDMPGAEEEPKVVETDTRKIMKWFAEHH
jgi:hypothetical protein